MADEYPPTKRALLIGIQYDSWPTKDSAGVATECDARLHGPHNNVDQLHRLLLKHGYSETDITIMKDIEGHPSDLEPTRDNIIREMEKFAKCAGPKSQFVFLYAGHGENIRGPKAESERDGKDEAIVPVDAVDYDESKYILDDDLHKNLVAGLPENSHLFAIIDACHSATMLDLRHRKCNATTFSSIVPTIVIPTPSPSQASTHEQSGTNSPSSPSSSTTPWKFSSEPLHMEPRQHNAGERASEGEGAHLEDDATPMVELSDPVNGAQKPVLDLTRDSPEEISPTEPTAKARIETAQQDLANLQIASNKLAKLGDSATPSSGRNDPIARAPTPVITLSRGTIDDTIPTRPKLTRTEPTLLGAGDPAHLREKAASSPIHAPVVLRLPTKPEKTIVQRTSHTKSDAPTSPFLQEANDDSIPPSPPTSRYKPRIPLVPIQVEMLQIPLRKRGRRSLGLEKYNECNGDCLLGSATARSDVISLSACADWERSLEKDGYSMTDMIIKAFDAKGTLSVQHALDMMHHIYEDMFQEYVKQSQKELERNEDVESNARFEKKVIHLAGLYCQHPQVSSMKPLPLDARICLSRDIGL